MVRNISEQELVTRARGGDRRCFDILVTIYERRLMGLLCRILSNPQDAEDLCQDVLLRAWQALPSFRGDSAFYTWLYRIAINVARNHMRQQAKNRSISLENFQGKEQTDLINVLKDNDTPDRLYERDRVWDTICEALDALPKELRVAINLREVEGMSYDDIAKAMDCPIGTVRSRIFRARAVIEDSLHKLYESDRNG